MIWHHGGGILNGVQSFSEPQVALSGNMEGCVYYISRGASLKGLHELL